MVSFVVVYDVCFGYTLKGLVEQRLNRIFLANDLSFDIGHIEGGAFRNVISSDITINHPSLKGPVKLQRVEIPYRFWYPFMRRYGIFPNLRKGGLKVFFGSNSIIDGYFIADGSRQELNIQGCYSLFNKGDEKVVKGEFVRLKDSVYKIKAFFHRDLKVWGEVDLAGKDAKLTLKRKKGVVNVSAFKSGPNRIVVKAFINHLDVNGADLIGSLDVSIEYGPDGIYFNITLDDMIVNYLPFDKLIRIEGVYRDREGRLIISSVKVTQNEQGEFKQKDILSAQADVNLIDKKELDINVVMKDLPVQDFILTKHGIKLPYSGYMNGEISVQGKYDKPASDIHISIRDGRIGKFEFNSLIATLKGEGSVLTIVDGRVVKDDGCLIAHGEIDLARLSDGHAYDNMKVETDQKLAVWEGWEITKKIDTSEIRAKKKLGKDDVTLSFETYANEDLFHGVDDDKENRIGVEYKLDKNESVKMELKEEESFVGMEHKVKF